MSLSITGLESTAEGDYNDDPEGNGGDGHGHTCLSTIELKPFDLMNSFSHLCFSFLFWNDPLPLTTKEE